VASPVCLDSGNITAGTLRQIVCEELMRTVREAGLVGSTAIQRIISDATEELKKQHCSLTGQVRDLEARLASDCLKIIESHYERLECRHKAQIRTYDGGTEELRRELQRETLRIMQDVEHMNASIQSLRGDGTWLRQQHSLVSFRFTELEKRIADTTVLIRELQAGQTALQLCAKESQQHKQQETSALEACRESIARSQVAMNQFHLDCSESIDSNQVAMKQFQLDCRESIESSQVAMKQFQLDCRVMMEERTLESEAKQRAAMAEETGRLRVALEIGGEASEARVRDLVAEQATSLRGILTEQNKQCEYLAHFQRLHEHHQRHHEDSVRFREGLQKTVKLIEEQLWQLQVAPAEAVALRLRDIEEKIEPIKVQLHEHFKRQQAEELRLRDVEEKIEPVKVQLHEHVKRQQAELSDSHEHLKVLHEKLQNAVVKGYEAVDTKFRELLSEQGSMLKLELGQASEAQRALQVASSATGLAEACEYADKQQKELQVAISTLREEFQECCSKHIKRTDGLERRLEETAQQSKLQMQDLPDALATRSQVLLEKHGQTCMARISDSERHLEMRHAELESVVAGGADVLKAKLHENVMQHCADHQQQFALQCQAFEDRLCELNAKHEAESLNHVEQQYHELQDALNQHVCGQTRRLDEMNEQVVAAVDNVHQAVEQRLNLQLSKLSEQSQQDGLRFVGKECAHRLHALAYSLLEISARLSLQGQSRRYEKDARSSTIASVTGLVLLPRGVLRHLVLLVRSMTWMRQRVLEVRTFEINCSVSGRIRLCLWTLATFLFHCRRWNKHHLCHALRHQGLSGELRRRCERHG